MADVLDISSLLSSAVEPKRTFRWIIALNGVDAYTALSTKRPGGGTFEETVIDYINTKRYLAGKFAPEDWTLVLWDPIAPSAAQKIMEWVRLNYENTTGRMGYADIYKKNISLKLLDPPGGVAEEWSIIGAWPRVIDFGSLDYKTSDLVNITCTIRYDFSSLNF